jgi:hypothetical protein
LLSKKKKRHIYANHSDVILRHVDVCYLGYNYMMCAKQVLMSHSMCNTDQKCDTESLKEKARKCLLMYSNVIAITEDYLTYIHSTYVIDLR